MKVTARPFFDGMTVSQRALGGIYFPMHFFILPLFIGMLSHYIDTPISGMTANIIYYAPGMLFCFTVMNSYMRRAFDVLLDGWVTVLMSILTSFVVYFILSYAVSAIMIYLLQDGILNPNNQSAADLIVEEGAGKYMALAVFIAPIVEEVLFRGVLFGSIRRRWRVAAYIISIAAFAFYHIWQYLLIDLNPIVFVYMLQYIPAGYVLARCYEQTSCIWTPIFFHMLVNFFSVSALS